MAEVFEWKTERDDETIIRTHAWSPPGCHPVGCGLQLHVKDGKIVKVEGEPSHPITRGALCPRCLALKEFIYHPDRVIYPQKRAREDRGLDKWERITWDEAYDIIETNAKRIIAEYGEEAIMVFGGTGRQANTYYPPDGIHGLRLAQCMLRPVWLVLLWPACHHHRAPLGWRLSRDRQCLPLC